VIDDSHLQRSQSVADGVADLAFDPPFQRGVGGRIGSRFDFDGFVA
jgi:hypothetical protein